MPTISVIVPAFNAERDLERALKSVAAQTFQDWECVVVDDASVDGTAKIVEGLSHADPRFKLVPLAQNSGVQFARSTGVEAAEGRYLAFLDADDWLEPTFLSLLHEAAITGELDITLCNARTAQSEYGPFEAKVRLKKGIHSAPQVLPAFGHFRFGTGVFWNKLYRRETVAELFSATKSLGLKAGEDYLVNIGAFARARKVGVIPKVLYNYFERPESISRAAPPIQGFTRTLIAYAASLEFYRDEPETTLSAIDNIFTFQLALPVYKDLPSPVWSGAGATVRESMSRILQVRPSAVHALVQSFALEKSGRPRTWKDEVRLVIGATKRMFHKRA